jgi:hypothetical protein
VAGEDLVEPAVADDPIGSAGDDELVEAAGV